MASVTQRIKQIKQPYGGYLKPSEFMTIQMKDNITLNDENIFENHVEILQIDAKTARTMYLSYCMIL